MKLVYALILALAVAPQAFAQAPQTSNLIPAAIGVDGDTATLTEPQLKLLDLQYEKSTGISAHLPAATSNGCERATCHIYALVNKSNQTLELFIDGVLTYTW